MPKLGIERRRNKNRNNDRVNPFITKLKMKPVWDCFIKIKTGYEGQKKEFIEEELKQYELKKLCWKKHYGFANIGKL